MKNKFLISLFALATALLLACVCFCAPVLSPMPEKTFEDKSLAEYASLVDVPDIEGKYGYAINLDTGTVVYAKNAHTKAAPANTVKLMTAITAYENIPDLDVVITATQSAVSNAQGSNMAIKAGESFKASELFYGLLVRGANDAALVLAEYVSGSEQEFVSLMNKKAKQIGANDTNFENVTGFHTANSYTTARDMGIIAQYMYYIPELFDMSNTIRYVVKPTDITNHQRTLINRNMLLSKVISSDYYYPLAKGMSLGSTPEGGHCIVSSVTGRNGLTYLCVVLNSREENDINYACRDIIKLFDFCLEEFSIMSVASVKNVVCEIPVKNAVDVDHIALFPEKDIQVLLPNDMDFTRDLVSEKRLFAETAYSPVNKGDAFGEIVVRYKDEAAIGTVNLVSNVAVDRSNVLYFFSRIENVVTGTWFRVFAITALLLFAVYFGMSVYLRYFKRNRYTGNRRKRR